MNGTFFNGRIISGRSAFAVNFLQRSNVFNPTHPSFWPSGRGPVTDQSWLFFYLFAAG